MKFTRLLLTLLTLLMGLAFMSEAAQPFKGSRLKYGAGDEAVFTSGVRIYSISYTASASASWIDLYSSATKTGSAVLRYEQPTASKTEIIHFDREGGAVFPNGLTIDVDNAGDYYTVEYSNL